jgi:hypothetical protein
VKTRAGEPVSIIEGRAPQVIRALAIDEKLDAVLGDNRIARLSLTEGHFVLESGATAFGDPDAQALVLGFAVRFEEAAQLPDCVIRHGDHGSSEAIARVGQVKPGAFPSQSEIGNLKLK